MNRIIKIDEKYALSVAVVRDMKFTGGEVSEDSQLEVAILDDKGIVSDKYLIEMWGDYVRPHIESVDELLEVITEVKKFIALRKEAEQGQLEFQF